jgi:hypothetical protein
LVVTVIEVKPRKWGWCVFESPGVEPVFLQKDQAIGYAETRARLRTGEIRILDSTGKVERVIMFNRTVKVDCREMQFLHDDHRKSDRTLTVARFFEMARDGPPLHFLPDRTRNGNCTAPN